MVAMHSMDFGDACGSHRGWLKSGAGRSRRRRVELGLEEEAVAAAFVALKRVLLQGRWGDVSGLLSARIQGRATRGELVEVLRSRAGMLRKAYRDAGVVDVEVVGDSSRLTLDWGRLGFARCEMRLVREQGSWRFDRVPWGDSLIACAGTDRSNEAAMNLKEHSRHDWGRRREGPVFRKLGLLLLTVMLIFGTLIALAHGQPWIALGVGAATAASIWVAALGGRKRPPRSMPPQARSRR